MKSTSVTNLKASLSAFLSYVKAGSRVLITEHNTPIAIIYPYAAGDEESNEKYTSLVKDGLLTPPRKSKKRRAITITPIEIDDSQGQLINSLLAERESGW